MATRLSPEEKQAQVQSLLNEARRAKTATAQFERTASRKVESINKLITKGTTKFDEALSILSSRLGNESKSFRDKAQAELNSVESLRKDTKRRADRFDRTYRVAMNKTNGVEAKHAKIVTLTSDATEKFKEISRNETRTKNASEQIAQLLTSSKSKSKTITAVHDEALELSQEIKNTYALTLDATMAGTFIERRDSLKIRTRNWERAYLASIVAIVATIVIALAWNPPGDFIEAITERLVFVTPLVVIAFVLAKQFGHERKLYEEYAFKAAAAQSLRGYTVLLNQQFKDMEPAREHILEFTISAMKNIYDREPLAPSPTITHLIFGNDMARFEAKIEDKLKEAVKDATKAAVETRA